MTKILSQDFFNRSTLTVAKELLGCFLCRRIGRRVARMEITEVEAYDGFEDKASHARFGKTKRNEPMFGEAGVWYVYLTYGLHWMLNITTGPVGYPAAILIRGGILCGSLASTDSVKRPPARLNGPARLTKFLQVDKRFNDTKAVVETGLWLEAAPVSLKGNGRAGTRISRTPRIGVGYASEWAAKPYRFVSVSKDLISGTGE